MTHKCELCCHPSSDGLSHCIATDEYLCEPCMVIRAEQYLYNPIDPDSVVPSTHVVPSHFVVLDIEDTTDSDDLIAHIKSALRPDPLD